MKNPQKTVRFKIQLFMRDGKTYQGIREAPDKYTMMKLFEAKLLKWENYQKVAGFIIDELKEQS